MTEPTPNHPVTAAHRPGGKFAAMAASASTSAPSPSTSAAPPPPPTTTTTATTGATAAHRPGGKFAAMAAASSAPSAPIRGKFMSPPEQPRGKFMTPPSNTPQQQPDPQEGLQIPIPHRSATSQQKQKREQLQKELYSDLDTAENLVLDLLQIASSTTKTLSNMTTSCTNENEKILVKNQEDYLSKLKKIHDLLSPHSHLVVAYSNHKMDAVDTKPVDTTLNSENSVIVIDVDQDDTTDTAVNIETCNMYAARIERRLALERREVMKLFLETEKQNDKKDEGEGCKRQRVEGNEAIVVE